MKQKFPTRLRQSRFLAGGLIASLVLISACATTSAAPDAALAAARVAIASAERADASHYAGAELNEARQKLALADLAVGEERMLEAGRLAQESRVQAELAGARTTASKALAVNVEMERGADALTEEMQRAGDQK